MVTLQADDRDSRLAALRKVSAELDELVKNRTVIPLTDAEQTRYKALCEWEQELLSQIEVTTDTGAQTVTAVGS